MGQQVNTGTSLGIIGTVGSSHLHIEIRTLDPRNARSSGSLSGNSPVLPFQAVDGTATPTFAPNKYGILQIGLNPPPSVYDIMQFFQNPVSAYQDEGSSTLTTVSGLGINVREGSNVQFGTSCTRPVRGPGTNNATPLATTTQGIRGFNYNSRGLPNDPAVTATPPSIYPTFTPTPIP